MVARIVQKQGCKTAAVVTTPLPLEGLDSLAYALVALKMLAGVDRLVTVPLGELLRQGVSEEDVLRARYATSPGLEVLSNLLKAQEWHTARQHLLAQLPQTLRERSPRGKGRSFLI